MDDNQFNVICKKLDKLTAIIGTQNIEDRDDRIYALRKMGLTSDEVGLIVGIKKIRDTKGWKKK